MPGACRNGGAWIAPVPNLRELPETLKQKLGFPPSLIRQEFAGREFVVRKGTIRSKPDYDDAWLLACAQYSHCAIDVGANIGQAALLMLLPHTMERLVLIDPNPSALSLAADNLIRNDLAWNVNFVCAFASDKADETIRFWTIGAGSAGSSYPEHAKTASSKNIHLDVRTVTIDGLVEHFGLTPDLVKIDVEGAEYQVLSGSKLCASQGKARFFVEMHSNSRLPMVDNATQVLKWCKEQDYRAWYLKEHVELVSPVQIQHRGRCHLLLQPKEWSFPELLEHINQSDPLSKVISHELSAS